MRAIARRLALLTCACKRLQRQAAIWTSVGVYQGFRPRDVAAVGARGRVEECAAAELLQCSLDNGLLVGRSLRYCDAANCDDGQRSRQ